MRDSCGREIAYLRLSLTERCNLACVYCRGGAAGPGSGSAGEPAGEPGGELSIDEIKQIVPCMIALGIRKVRLTGGEPLLRGDLEEVVAYLGSRREIRDLAMTTNGQGLARRAPALKQAGLGRVNISLDSLKPDRYRELTGGGSLEDTLAGVRAALDWGLAPVKLNCVILRGHNDDEVGDFIALAREQPLHVRFIELMPFGGIFDAFGEAAGSAKGNAAGGSSAEKLRVVSAEILASHGELYEPAPDTKGGPEGSAATVYTGKGFRGTVGFISPLSRPFCRACNRVRITADGRLKTCLGNNDELDLRALMDKPDTVLRSAIEGELRKKPGGHHFGGGFVSRRTMNRIGG